MIIARYLTRQLVLSTAAVTLILLLILLSARFIRYLTLAASGELATDILFPLILYRLPDILELILPLGLSLGVLISYSRMYLDNEMTALFFGGLSQLRLMLYTLPTVLFITAIVVYFSFYGGPWGLAEVDRLFSANAARTEFDAVFAGRFESMDDKGRVVYVESISDKRKLLHEVFIYEPPTTQKIQNNDQQTLIVAEQGYLQASPADQSRFLVLENGYRIDGVPGHLDYRTTQFAGYGIKLPSPISQDRPQKPRSTPTRQLLSTQSPAYSAELQWRISIPFLVPIISLLGVALSRVPPRKDRYFRIFLGTLIYAGYLVLLTTARSSIEDGLIPPLPGLWQVHFGFLLLTLMTSFEVYKYIPSLLKFRRQI